MAYKYHTLVVGGTFDRLHAGHKAFLLHAFSLAEKVYITIMSDRYTKVHKPHAAPFAKRKKDMQDFLQQENLLQRGEIVAIDDVYGITDGSVTLDAILVTPDTIHGAKLVNTNRIKNNFSELAIEIMPLVSGESGMKISSTDIRSGAIDTKGTILLKNKFLQTVLQLPQSLRRQLQEPFGKIVKDFQEMASSNVITVGDVTTRIFNEQKKQPDIAIIDFTVERKKQQNSLEALGFASSEIVRKVTNPASQIVPQVWRAIEESLQDTALHKKTVIIVAGEEDLAVLPALVLAPIGFTIYYGQPHVGMIAVPVTEETKERAFHLLASFASTH